MGKKVLPATRSQSGCVISLWPHRLRKILEDIPKPLYKWKPQTQFCEGCEFVRIMSDDGRGYCQKHGDINGGPSDDQ